jgi:osmoprotectant transport system permease protein
MNYLSTVFEWLSTGSHWRGSEGVPNRLVEHLQLSWAPIVLAVLIAVPIGLVLGHYRKGEFVAVNTANVGRAIPALSILLLAVLVWGIGSPPSVFRWLGVVSLPTFLALLALALPPILTNTHAGIVGVDPTIRDAARGMGMSDREILRQVELPLASPLIMAGVRTSAVAVVATATLAAYVGEGGLGRFIIDGSAINYSDPRIFVGALFVAVLAMIVELLLALTQRLIVPKPLRWSVEDRVRVAT